MLSVNAGAGARCSWMRSGAPSFRSTRVAGLSQCFSDASFRSTAEAWEGNTPFLCTGTGATTTVGQNSFSVSKKRIHPKASNSRESKASFNDSITCHVSFVCVSLMLWCGNVNTVNKMIVYLPIVFDPEPLISIVHGSENNLILTFLVEHLGKKVGKDIIE